MEKSERIDMSAGTDDKLTSSPVHENTGEDFNENLAEGNSFKPPKDLAVADALGKEVLLTTISPQLNILGQVFRPIFCGRVTRVTAGYITLDPAIIKMSNAPFFKFPTPLNFPIELISNLALFECETRFPIP